MHNNKRWIIGYSQLLSTLVIYYWLLQLDTVSFQSLISFPDRESQRAVKDVRHCSVVRRSHRCDSRRYDPRLRNLVVRGAIARIRVRSARYKSGTKPCRQCTELENLSTELVTVINWFLLGINLGLPKHELSKIQQNYAHQGNDQQRVEMLYLWLQRTPNATWEDVVRALEQMGENRVAENIREKCIRGRSKL